MKHINKIQELLREELGDYSIFNDNSKPAYPVYEISLEDESGDAEFYIVEFSAEVNRQMKINDLNLKAYIGRKGKDENHFFIAVRMGEDNWYDIETFDWTIKYFWQALLWQ